MGKSIIREYGVFICVLVLTFYVFGASMVDHYVIYPTFHAIGEQEWTAYRAVFGPRILLWLVVPSALHTLFSIFLLWSRPRAIPLWSVIVILACQAVRWASTALLQVPIQLQLNQGKNGELIDRLMQTGFIRTAANAAGAAVVVWMFAAVLRNFAQNSRPTS
jgi:hypothetical protein